MPEERRHAAIVFTDIVGYTSLMGSDEDKAFEVLQKNRKIHTALIGNFGGTLIKEMGDGMLISFNLASEAVRCAIKIQKACKEQDIPLKIGIHEGEMVFAGADVLGDGVNIASRLQEDADEGCINISSSVYKDIRNKADINTRFVEERTFKNVVEPVKVYEVLCEEDVQKATKVEESEKSRTKLVYYIIVGLLAVITSILIWYFVWKQPGSPFSTEVSGETPVSIAVLPFVNLSGDPEQEAMCDGLTEEIIHHLSIIRDFDKVISRTSTMMFKESDKSLPEIAEMLGVNTIVEGSFRRSGERLRITVQLIDAVSDKHIWSEIYERPVGDIFDIQSDIAKNIAAEVKIELSQEYLDKINQLPTSNITSYNLLNEASFVFNSSADFEFAIELVNKAILEDPDMAEAYAYLARLHFATGIFWGVEDYYQAINKSRKAAENALELDPEMGEPYYVLSMIYFWSDWEFEKAIDEVLLCLEKDPHHAMAETALSGYLTQLGDTDLASTHNWRAYELDPLNKWVVAGLVSNYFDKGEIEKAIEVIRNANELFGKNMGFIYEAIARGYLDIDSLDSAIFYIDQHRKWWFESNKQDYPRSLFISAVAHKKSGNNEESEEYLSELKERMKVTTHGSPAYFVALYYAAIKDRENAFKYLEIALDNRSPEMPWLKVERYFEFLKDDPRYWDLYERVGFKEYDEYLEKEGIQ